jgi:peptide chain release factor 1
MYDKLKFIKNRYNELSELLSTMEVILNQEKFRQLSQEHASIADTVARYDQLLSVDRDIEESRQIIGENADAELVEFARMELPERLEKKEELENKLKELLIPRDPSDDKNVILEIRAGTGGEEAALFGARLLRMYTRYAERHNYKIEVMSASMTELGGVKEMILLIAGRCAYARLKFESGVHRVQRVPETESGGRIHTSAATVAVLPEADEVDVNLNPNDLRIDVFRSGGHGGQSVNTTDSAVRITHIPTGVTAVCQDEKSQLKNKQKAMKVLSSRLYDMMKEESESELALSRKSQVGSGDRSERVRTYNFPQGRVTDHRIGMTLYKLESFLDGDMDEMIDALTMDLRQKSLSE